MRQQLKNSVSALLLQVVTVAVGLIIPRFMIMNYGSHLVGLASSISQFLSYITLIEGGIGGVTRAALYKALAKEDWNLTSRILKATELFFHRIAGIFFCYVALLSFAYPRIVNDAFESVFTASLIFIIAVSTLVQYSYGITYSIFLQADRKPYINNTVQIFTVLLNAVMTLVLINFGASFHSVKLMSALVYIIRPFALAGYVRKKYKLDYHAQPDNTALSQRWHGMAQHTAWFLTSNTDIIVITLLGAISDVAVYSVYYMVAASMTKIAIAVTSGFEGRMGKKYAQEGRKNSVPEFQRFVIINTSCAIVLFTTAGCMLMPFINLYTQNITDANYNVPLLGYALLLAEALYVLRHPYGSLCIAVGHFKQTQTGSIIEAVLNIVLSIAFIKLFGIVGVAVATVIALGYRTLDFILHVGKEVLPISLEKHLCYVFFALLICIGMVWIKNTWFAAPIDSYLDWAWVSVIWVAVSAAICAIYNLIFWQEQLVPVFARFLKLKS